jgi:hypothetical protein
LKIFTYILSMSIANEAILHAKENGYYVDKLGNVYSPVSQILSQKIWDNRYSFGLRYGGTVVRIKTHKFVAFFKFGDKIFEEGIEVRHLDSNSLNNKWENIDIGTHSENMMDMDQNKRIKKSINAATTWRRFSDEEVLLIKLDRKNGMKYVDLCEKYNTSKSTLSYLFNEAYYSGANSID